MAAQQFTPEQLAQIDLDDLDRELLAGPNALQYIQTKKGKILPVRSGTRSERSAIEKKWMDFAHVYDAIAITLYHRLANLDGTPRYHDRSLKAYAASLDNSQAAEIATLIRQLDEPERPKSEDPNSLDDEPSKEDLRRYGFDGEVLDMGNDSKSQATETGSDSSTSSASPTD